VSGDRTFRQSRHVSLGISRATRGRQRPRQRPQSRWWGIQRSLWTGLRGSVRHGRQCVQVDLHDDDISRSEGDR
jgi:hypothetical protein